MKQTPNYNLPLFEVGDKFNKETLNEGYSKIDLAINDLQETFNTNATGGALTTQEVVEARKGKETLKDRIDGVEADVVLNKTQISEATEQLDSNMKKTKEKYKEEIEPLMINSFDGSYDALHPSVVYIPTKFSGYEYYMCYTPLTSAPPYADRWECPCIMRSSDGLQWHKPVGLANPIDNLQQSEIDTKDYFSDPTIIYNNDLNRLEVYYRYSYKLEPTRAILYRKTSTDGVIWSERELVYDSSIHATLTYEYEIKTQQMFYENGTYTMFYNTLKNGSPCIRKTTTTNPLNDSWTIAIECSINRTPSNHGLIDHIGMTKYNNVFYMLAMPQVKNGIQPQYISCYTSLDGINFDYKGISIDIGVKSKGDLKSLYMSYPLVVDGVCNIYATGLFRYWIKDNYVYKNHLFLMQGSSFTNVSPVKGNLVTERKVFFNDVLLANTDKINKQYRNLKYLVYENEDRSVSYGYGINMTTKTPVWQDQAPWEEWAIPTAQIKTDYPQITPKHQSAFWIDSANNRAFMGVNTTDKEGWKQIQLLNRDGTPYQYVTGIRNSGSVVNRKVVGINTVPSQVDVSGQYLINIEADGNIQSFSNGIDGQEIVIISSCANLIIKYNIGTTDKILLKAKADKSMSWNDTLKLIRYNSRWYEI